MAAVFHTRFIRAGGFRTHLIEAGEPGRPAVVLVHDGAYGTDAATSHTAIFADRAVALALRDIRTHQQRFDRGDGHEL